MAGSAANSGGIWSAKISWQDLDPAVLVPPDVSSHLGGRATGEAVLKDGVIRGNALRRDGTVRDTVMYSLSRGEWPEVQAHLLDLLAQSDRKAKSC